MRGSVKKFTGLLKTVYVIYLDLRNDGLEYRYELGRCKLLLYRKKKMINLLECAPREENRARVESFSVKGANTSLVYSSEVIDRLQQYIYDSIGGLTEAEVFMGNTITLQYRGDLIKKGLLLNFSELRVGVFKKGAIKTFKF